MTIYKVGLQDKIIYFHRLIFFNLYNIYGKLYINRKQVDNKICRYPFLDEKLILHENDNHRS